MTAARGSSSQSSPATASSSGRPALPARAPAAGTVQTFKDQRERDPEFSAQWQEAAEAADAHVAVRYLREERTMELTHEGIEDAYSLFFDERTRAAHLAELYPFA